MIEKFLLGGAGPGLSELAAEHYRGVQANRDDRCALAVMPGQIRTAGPLLASLNETVATTLGDKPALAVWGMRDRVFPPRWCMPRIRSTFADLEIVHVEDAGHFVPDEAPERIVTAIQQRFPACSAP